MPATVVGEALSTSRVVSFTEFERLADAWNQLAADVPFRRYEWCHSWWRHYQRPTSGLFTLAVRDVSGELVGLAPWFMDRSPWQGRVIRFLGSGEVCSDHMTVLAAPGRLDQVCDELAGWLTNEARGDWDLIALESVDAADQAVRGLVARMSDAGHLVDEQPGPNCWRLPLPATWDDYLKLLSKSRRERVRSLLRKNFGSGLAEWRLVECPEQLADAFELLVRLHQERRQSLGEPGCFSSPRFTAFHRETAARLLESGRLRLHWTEVEGRPVAVEYGMTGGQTIYFYQSGLDPSVSELRPGWLSMIQSIKRAIEDKQAVFDFLRGDEPYKASWRAEPEATSEIRVVAQSPWARGRYNMWKLGVAFKREAKSRLTRLTRAKSVDATPADRD